MEQKMKLFIAHRGESYEAPENTISAINLAWEKGVGAVEIDIHLTKDDQIVVIHDKNTVRTTGRRKVIKNTNLGELKKLDAGLYKGSRWKGEKIPTLNEVLNTVPNDGKLIIELKSDRKILPKLRDEISVSGLFDSQIEIIAFDLELISEVKKLMPQYRMYWLLEMDYSRPVWLVRMKIPEIIRKVKENNLDGVSVWAGRLLTAEFIEKFKENGLFVFAWIINDPLKAKELFDLGIDGVTSDKAWWMDQQVSLM